MEKTSSRKVAKTDFDLHSVIKERWSPRAFSEQVPDKRQVLKLLEAARWSASCFNEQPWRFIIGMKGEGDSHEKVLKSLNEFNQKWAKNAPVLLLVCAKKHFTHNEKPNRHYLYDCGAAMASLTFQATTDGLYVHQMAGILPEKAVEIFEVPEEYEVITGAAIGYLGNPDLLDEKNRQSELAERQRKSLDEISFEDSWDESFIR